MTQPRRAKGPSTDTANPSRNTAVSYLKEAAANAKLAIIIGTGVSVSLTDNKFPALSWKGLIRDGFSHAASIGKINREQERHWQSQIASTDLDDLISAAEFMGRKLGAPKGDLYARWLEGALGSAKASNKQMIKAIKSAHAINIPLCTLNYDNLLEQVTGLPSITISNPRKLTAFVRREEEGVLHLHGAYQEPETCVLGIRDYEQAISNDVRDLVQRSLAAFGRLLFVGCGGTFSDPNFVSWIGWLRKNLGAASPRHYALVTESEVAQCLADVSWHGFVEPLVYGKSHSDLPKFILKTFSGISITPTARKRKTTEQSSSQKDSHEGLLRAYRDFLLKDCGEMTIEGVRADSDTAQRRFNLERLFVPLRVQSCPPDIAEEDPRRAEKLELWQAKHQEPRPFGDAFKKHPRVALLALPGGGKTLLLKRLAVAYAEPARRSLSDDGLPELDLTPVLIRCREWKEHAHRPILSLLDNMSSISGRPALSGLREALVPLFKKGKVLLLVDGLDEIHDNSLRSIFVENLGEFLREYKRVRLVVTSREAGFNLVAPLLAVFCEKWRIAPLEERAISLLCLHWHRLMGADSPEAKAEAEDVAESILRRDPLRRLAENPLLLTMLLVVKHGAGRLPPDRVSLYGRAVDVLLNTWNNKGHEPLNPKEAIPQLAYVAYKMMMSGLQTATEADLLILLQEAREKVPLIKLYAKDTPHDFLKRVELRSSLLVEGGHQTERGTAVPFYQFRHLTFQEYLAAVAVVEGHYPDYSKEHTVLTPLRECLLVDEWKEVVPMASVLAKKAAEPLMAALVTQGAKSRAQVERGDFHEVDGWLAYPPVLPSSIVRIVQCLTEEVEVSPETLGGALRIISFFSRGGWPDGIADLSHGLYGAQFYKEAWSLYKAMDWPLVTWLHVSCAKIASWQKLASHWVSDKGLSEIEMRLSSPDVETAAFGLFVCAGLLWGASEDFRQSTATKLPLSRISDHLFSNKEILLGPAVLAWRLVNFGSVPSPPASPEIWDRLLEVWTSERHDSIRQDAAIALGLQLGQPRDSWNPVLNSKALKYVLKCIDSSYDGFAYSKEAALAVAFYARNIMPEADLAEALSLLNDDRRFNSEQARLTLLQMGALGKRYLSKWRGRNNRNKETSGS